jgi:hypothetical protein
LELSKRKKEKNGENFAKKDFMIFTLTKVQDYQTKGGVINRTWKKYWRQEKCVENFNKKTSKKETARENLNKGIIIL